VWQSKRLEVATGYREINGHFFNNFVVSLIVSDNCRMTATVLPIEPSLQTSDAIMAEVVGQAPRFGPSILSNAPLIICVVLLHILKFDMRGKIKNE
jgi:hypothetical protein